MIVPLKQVGSVYSYNSNSLLRHCTHKLFSPEQHTQMECTKKFATRFIPIFVHVKKKPKNNQVNKTEISELVSENYK